NLLSTSRKLCRKFQLKLVRNFGVASGCTENRTRPGSGSLIAVGKSNRKHRTRESQQPSRNPEITFHPPSIGAKSRPHNLSHQRPLESRNTPQKRSGLNDLQHLPPLL
ncbi:hypothetical protein, partial [Rhodocyclus gracilis]|uniref:hypothetical protein n=1 Tax=Rhodocyclus gracilis TaxID=2929842 RepID=UPI001E59D8F7